MWTSLTFHWQATHLHKYTNTNTDLLYHCGFLHTHNTPTTMTWRDLHHAGAYTYSTAIYPWALTTHRLCRCGVAGAPLPVCLSICLSICLSSLSHNSMMANKWRSDSSYHSCRWSQRRFGVTVMADMFFLCWWLLVCIYLDRLILEVLLKVLLATAQLPLIVDLSVL